MAAASYLREIAARGSAERGRTTLEPRRMLFRPIPLHAVPLLEGETAIAPPPRPVIAGPDPPPIGTTPPSPIAASRPEPRQTEAARIGGVGTAWREVLAVAQQGMSGDPVRPQVSAAEPVPAAARAGPTRPRDAGRDPALAPAPLQRRVGSGEIAARAVPSAARDPLSPSGDLHGRALRDPEATRTGSAENIAAREERILLTPPVNSGPRRSSGAPNTGTARASAGGGVHIGSLEVHVTAPPPTIAPPLPSPAPQTNTPSARAVAPLARGFPGFGLVQS